MKNSGFTLIELLATLVVMSIIMVLAVQSYFNIVAGRDETKYEYYKKIIFSVSDVLLESRKNIMESGECLTISYQTLVDSGKLKEDEITCTGLVQLTKTGKKFTYSDANLECKNSKNEVVKDKTVDVDNRCSLVNIN